MIHEDEPRRPLSDQEALESAAICRRLFMSCDALLLTHSPEKTFLPFMFDSDGKYLTNILLAMRLRLPWALKYRAIVATLDREDSQKQKVRIAKVMPGGDVLSPRMFIDNFDNAGTMLVLDRFNGRLLLKETLPPDSFTDASRTPYLIIDRGRPSRERAEYFERLVTETQNHLNRKTS